MYAGIITPLCRDAFVNLLLFHKLRHEYLARSCRLRARPALDTDASLNLESLFLVKKCVQ